MTIYKRMLLLVAAFVLTLIVLLPSTNREDITSSRIWSKVAQTAKMRDEENTLTKPHLPDDVLSFQPGQVESKTYQEPSSFSPGVPKPPGSTYSKAVVIGRLLSENTTWLDTADLPSDIQKHIYNTDPFSSPSQASSLLTLPKLKGHEAMVYLTYIISHYDDLPDINIFMHAHQLAWHNDEMLNHDAVEMIRRLSAERVVREGYMNLRCHWKPGCPEYIHPHTTVKDKEKLEEGAMKDAWKVLFPEDKVPEVLASPCCAQFAVSKQRIRSIPLEKYILFRQWLFDTELDDYVSGRVFEYLWHTIFTGQSTLCPDMRVCYCDGYGICFEDDKEFDYWFELRYKKRQAETALKEWYMLVEETTRAEGRTKYWWSHEMTPEEKELEVVPALDGDVVLLKNIDEYRVMLEDRRLKALKAGTDPEIRARIAGRVWKAGDGY